MTLTHDELVKRAFVWLRDKKGCSIVASELVTGGMETPDVIGWHGWGSILVEAKISMTDDRADQKKTFRLSGRGMGIQRYYIVPEELKDKVLAVLPEGWGLLTCKPGRRPQLVKQSAYFENNKANEILYLSSVIRRIAMRAEPLKGINVRCYTFQTETKPKAELFIAPAVSEEVTHQSEENNYVPPVS
jgi:hypothetical protein